MKGLILDTNLLGLLVVGRVDSRSIGQHRRFRAYEQSDYLVLEEIVASFGYLIAPPHVLAETSNLLRYDRRPEAVLRLSRELARLIETIEEQFCKSSLAVQQPDYPQLGLTDAVLLLLAKDAALLLSDDLGLYLAADQQGLPAINYSHVREGGWTIDQVKRRALK